MKRINFIIKNCAKMFGELPQENRNDLNVFYNMRKIFSWK
jgi:hypothetical protein